MLQNLLKLCQENAISSIITANLTLTRGEDLSLGLHTNVGYEHLTNRFNLYLVVHQQNPLNDDI